LDREAEAQTAGVVLPAYIIHPKTIKDDKTLDDAPPETVALWIRLVRTMDAAMLASFVDRTWRTWSRESLRPLEAAVKARRPSSKRTKAQTKRDTNELLRFRSQLL
jgi:hypothetical protein